jgi:hypothetical protein
MLYTYPNGDSSSWSLPWDTTGLSSWTPMYNDPKDWENGAFSRYATGHPDYGWGVYNSITHDLHGDSCFIIKTRNGNLKRFFIVRKNSVNNLYVFRIANLDGSNSQEVSFSNTAYITKDFVGYDLQTMQAVDFQPAKTSWDILFTKYMSVQPDGTPYPVTGVLNNDGIYIARVDSVPTFYSNWSVQPFDSIRSVIGWDWKYFDLGAMTYIIVDELVYFVKNFDGNIAKLVFKQFDGSSTGNIIFSSGFLSAAGTPEITMATDKVSAYPNPAAGVLNYTVKSSVKGNASISIHDLTGRSMIVTNLNVTSGQTVSGQIDVSMLSAGVYLFEYQLGANRETRKLIIQK